MNERPCLYPEIDAYRERHLDVSNRHSIYLEESGNPNGFPVIFFHGGPGGRTSSAYRRFFDPKYYRIIMFDQRGCGRSTPLGETKENTTCDLISDIERIRQELEVDRWILFGGSWGSTLALLYAQAYPERVHHIVIRGVFLVCQSEMDWMYKSGANYIFPESWEALVAPIPVEERSNIIKAYHRRLVSNSSYEAKVVLARKWVEWERTINHLYELDSSLSKPFSDDDTFAFAMLECHYFFHNCFLDSEKQILENVWRIKEIPTNIIHGRYDLVSPFSSAHELKRAYPRAALMEVRFGGHSAFDVNICKALVETMNALRV